MKRVLLTSAAIVTLAASPAVATPGWYFGVAGGANWAQDTSPLTAFGDHEDTQFDTGWALAGTFGYSWLAGYRGEIEFAYRQNDLDSVFESPNRGSPFFHTQLSGDLVQFSVMANALYDFQVADDFVLTVGGGIGVAEARLNASEANVSFIRSGSNSFTFAWQLIGGAAYQVTDATQVFVEYHYFANDNHDVVTYPGGTPLRTDFDADSSTVFLGVRLGLGE